MTTQPPLLPLAAGTSTYRQIAGKQRLVQDSLVRVAKDPRMCAGLWWHDLPDEVRYATWRAKFKRALSELQVAQSIQIQAQAVS